MNVSSFVSLVSVCGIFVSSSLSDPKCVSCTPAFKIAPDSSLHDKLTLFHSSFLFISLLRVCPLFCVITIIRSSICVSASSLADSSLHDKLITSDSLLKFSFLFRIIIRVCTLYLFHHWQQNADMSYRFPVFKIAPDSSLCDKQIIFDIFLNYSNISSS